MIKRKYEFVITGTLEAQNKDLANKQLRKMFPKAKIVITAVVEKK